MSNVIKNKQDLIPVAQVHTELIDITKEDNSNHLMIKDIAFEDDLINGVDFCLKLVYGYRNQCVTYWDPVEKIDKETNEYIGTLKMFVRELKITHKAITIEELGWAMHQGVIGNYGEYYGLSIFTFLSWIKAYLNSSVRVQYSKRRQVKQLNQHNEMTEQQRQEANKHGSLQLFDDFRSTGDCNDRGNAVYDYLKNIGVLALDPDEIRKAYKHAKLMMDIQRKGIESLVDKRKISRMINDIDIDGTEGHDRAVMLGKKEAIKIFFKKLIDSKTDLKDLL